MFSVSDSSPYDQRYERSRPSNLWVIDRATDTPKRLFRTTLEGAVWSSDSKRVAGIEKIYAGHWRSHPRDFDLPRFRKALVVTDAATGKELARAVAAGVDEQSAIAGWLPDKRHVIFTTLRVRGQDMLKVLDIQTGKCEVFSHLKGGCSVRGLDVCARDGEIAAVRDGNIAIFKMSEGGVRMLTQDATGRWGGNCIPRWSRDGQRVAYQRTLNPHLCELWVVGRDGRGKVKLAEAGQIRGILWSPDSRELAWEGSLIAGNTAATRYDDLPGVESTLGRTGGFGGYWGPFYLYLVKLEKPVPKRVLVAKGLFGIAGWDRNGTLVCASAGAIFEVRP